MRKTFCIVKGDLVRFGATLAFTPHILRKIVERFISTQAKYLVQVARFGGDLECAKYGVSFPV